MQDLVTMENETLTASSRVIAEKFGKSHKNVLEAARKLKADLESDGLDFGRENIIDSTYQTDRGKTYECMLFTKDAFTLLAMGFKGKKALEWKLKYIEAFNKMQSYIAKDMGAESISTAINQTSLQLDNLTAQGSAWGKDGARIQREKRIAVTELKELVEKAQMQLNF